MKIGIDIDDTIAYTNEKLYCYLIGRDGAITSSFSEKKIKSTACLPQQSAQG